MKIVARLPKGEHVYMPEWGDNSPCAICMQAKDTYRFQLREFMVDLELPEVRKYSTRSKKLV